MTELSSGADPRPNLPLAEGAEHHLSDLLELRTSLRHEGLRPDVVRRAFELSRELGDAAVTELDTTGQASPLLRDTWPYSQPDPEDGICIMRLTNGAEAAYGDGILLIDPKAVHQVTRELSEVLHKIRVEYRDTFDPQLTHLLRVLGHESTHALVDGVEQWGYETGLFTFRPDSLNPLALPGYLIEHPELGFTGDWVKDLAITEERLAQGYSQLVLERALTALGYTDREISVISRWELHAAPELDGAYGENQIDHLDMDTPPTANHYAASIEQSPGYLGYGLPMNREELADFFSSLPAALHRAARWARGAWFDPETWKMHTRHLQKDSIRGYLNTQRRRRRAMLLSLPTPEEA